MAKDLVDWLISVDSLQVRDSPEVGGTCTISQVFQKQLVILRALFFKASTSYVLKEPIFWESTATQSFKTKLRAFETS